MLPRVAVQAEDFNLDEEIERLRAQDKRIGAICTFTGTVRDRNDGLNISSMELEHYPGMTEKAIEDMVDEAMVRFDILVPAWCTVSGCYSRWTRWLWWRSPQATAVKASRPASF